MKLKLIIVIIVALLLPIGFNYLLQMHVTEDIIGTPKDWLSFWGSYITAIISGVMVLFSYKAIRASEIIAEVQRKLQIHNNLRDAISKLRMVTDLDRLYELQQNLHDKKYSETKTELYKIRRSFNEASDYLDYIFIDRDILYNVDERKQLTKDINKDLIIVAEYINVLQQFAVMQDGWVHRSFGDLKYSEVLKLQEKPLSLIIENNPYNTNSKEDYSQKLLMAIANKFSSWDYKSFENKLLSIYKYDSKKAND